MGSTFGATTFWRITAFFTGAEQEWTSGKRQLEQNSLEHGHGNRRAPSFFLHFAHLAVAWRGAAGASLGTTGSCTFTSRGFATGKVLVDGFPVDASMFAEDLERGSNCTEAFCRGHREESRVQKSFRFHYNEEDDPLSDIGGSRRGLRFRAISTGGDHVSA